MGPINHGRAEGVVEVERIDENRRYNTMRPIKLPRPTQVNLGLPSTLREMALQHGCKPPDLTDEQCESIRRSAELRRLTTAADEVVWQTPEEILKELET